MARRHYLGFVGQCLSAIEADESLVGISGWNENGKQYICFLACVCVSVFFYSMIKLLI